MSIYSTFEAAYHQFYDALGQRKRWVPESDTYQEFKPGFIRAWAPTIKVAALALPILLDVLFVIQHRKEIKASLISLYEQLNAVQWRIPTFHDVEGFVKKHAYALAAGVLAVAAVIAASVIVGVVGLYPTLLFIEKVGRKAEVAKVVYTAYSCMAVAHAYLAKCRAEQGSYAGAARHLFGCFASVGTIMAFWKGIYETRWHHMSYGILALMPGFNAINSVGAFLVVDSMLYWPRQYKDNYDFENILTKNLSLFAIQLVALTCIEQVLHYLAKPIPKQTEKLVSV